MAKTKTETKTLERVYNIPLRREYLKVPNWKRTEKAVTAAKQFLQKHMKPSEDEKGRIQIKLGKHLNEKLWQHGIKNPPHHIKVTTTKDEKGIVRAELFGHKIDTGKKEEKKKTSKLQEIAKKAGIKVPAKASAGNEGDKKSPGKEKQLKEEKKTEKPEPAKEEPKAKEKVKEDKPQTKEKEEPKKVEEKKEPEEKKKEETKKQNN